MKQDLARIGKEQIASFRKHGYVCLHEVFPGKLTYELRQISDVMSCQARSILECCRASGMSLADRAKADPIQLIVVAEESSPAQVCRYEFMIGSNARLKEFVNHYVEPIVAELVNERVVAFKDKTNEKLPGGGAFRPHQDFAAYREFAPRYHATALLTIDPADIDNGCVRFATNVEDLVKAKRDFVLDTVEGRALLHYQEGGSYNGDIRRDIAAELSWHAVPTNPMDLIVFDSFVPHYSDANTSNRPRRAIFITFNRAAEGSFYDDYYTEKRLNYDDPKFHVSTPTSHRNLGRSLAAGGSR
jgi:2-aminoethylphosphonate dioxygenase